MTIEQKIQSLGLELPSPPKPVGAYVAAVRTGNLIFTAGQAIGKKDLSRTLIMPLFRSRLKTEGLSCPSLLRMPIKEHLRLRSSLEQREAMRNLAKLFSVDELKK